MRLRLIVIATCICLLIVTVVFFLHWHRSQIFRSHIANQINPNSLSNEVTITPWFLIGPFNYALNDISIDNPRANQGGLNHDFLADVGHPEDRLTEDAITVLCSDRKICSVHDQHGAILNFSKLFPGVTSAVMYAAAEISSPVEGCVGLEYAYNDGVKVWLNGKLLHNDHVSNYIPAFKYARHLPLYLKKGYNLLIIKVDQKKAAPPYQPWSLIASLMPIDQSRNIWFDRQDGELLLNRTIRKSESLHFLVSDNQGILPNKSTMHLSIADWSGTVRISKDISVEELNEVKLPRLNDGYYSVTLQYGVHTTHDAFYSGNADTVYKALLQMQHAATPKTQTYIQLDPIIQRYRILTSREYYHPLDPEWQKKLVLLLNDGGKALRFPKEASWTRMPGMHLREFVSKIDGTPQYYSLYIPSLARWPLPLIIFMPARMDYQRPFLESTHLAYPSFMRNMQNDADEIGVAIAVINGRGDVEDAAIGEADAFEVMEDINNYYLIDNKRMYLYGPCEGGRRALLLAEHFPGVFAAVGVYGPLLAPYGTDITNIHGDPLDLEDRLSATPAILVQGELDDRSPIVKLKTLYDRLRSLGGSSEFEIIPDVMHVTWNKEKTIFPYFTKYRNTRNIFSIEELTKEARSRVHP